MDAVGGRLEGTDSRSIDDWSDASVWVGDGLRREVFFFRSAGTDLYGSLVAAAEPSRPFGVVACGSWGVEADRTEPLVRSVMLTMARLGGAGLTFHYPGYGDSFGDLADLDLADLGQAASDAVAEASRRCPGMAWVLAGFMVGASVACLAQWQAGVDRLLLVQPALRPGTYFRELAGRTAPLAPGPSAQEMMEAGGAPGMAYGYPIPRRIVEADREVEAALAAFAGDGSVIRHPAPQEPDLAPRRFERMEVSGTWRFGSQNHPELARAAGDWLDRHTREAAG